MVRLNITIPEDLVKQLRQIRNKSGFIAQAIREKFEREKKEKLRKVLVEGYQKMTSEDALLNPDWERASLEDDKE